MTLNDVKNNPFLLDRLDHTGRQTYYKDGYKGQNVVVCVIDTGVNEHTELTGKLLNYNSDTVGHGTSCASLIAGTNIGIAPSCKILSYKRTDDTLDSVVAGMKFARLWRGTNGEKVNLISLSISSSSQYAGIYTEVKACWDAGILIVCSSGNNGKNDITYPAAFGETLTVGAVDNKMNWATWESWGQMLDVVQYGTYIITADASNSTTYSAKDGTSFSTPITCGICALYISKYYSLFKEYPTAKEVKRAIMQMSLDLGAPAEDDYYGVGFATLDVHIPKRVELQIGSDQMKVNGYSQTLNTAPIISATGSTLVPVRAISETFGATVSWDAATQKITITT